MFLFAAQITKVIQNTHVCIISLPATISDTAIF